MHANQFFSYLAVIGILLVWPACRSASESASPEPAVDYVRPTVQAPVEDAHPIQSYEPVDVDPTEAADYAQRILSDVTAQPAEGLDLDLWATEQVMENPIAIDISDGGDLYVTISERSVGHLDIRGHPTWTTIGLSLRSVEDLTAFLEEDLAPSRSELNEDWLPDYNEDGLHDWRDQGVLQERLVQLSDQSGDGIADRSHVLFEGLDDPITDVLGGLLVNEHGIYLSAAPHVWRLHDTTGDGLPDEMASMSYGYGVHPGFNGHGTSGITMGPDGRIYWSVGDMGYNVTGPDGREWINPYEGAIFRSEPDGTGFEVFATGLRNTHEFDFDAFGNLISVDNDGDHSGEEERIVYIVEGSDSGWRAHWQWGKYTDPRNNDYKVWMDEELFKPRFDGQAAFILPPIANYHSGPAGMVYNPGTALTEEWYDHFFVSEFTGSTATTNVHGFRLREAGAGFELAEEKVAVSGILTVGMDFSPDGALYLADWIEGWRSREAGRIWKLSAPTTPLQEETARLLEVEFADRSEEELAQLMEHADLRVRHKAQFELAGRGADQALLAVATGSQSRLARLHGLWGIWQLARQDVAKASMLEAFLADEDSEIRAQAAKVIGDVGAAAAARSLMPLLQDANARVRFFAAEALGRVGYSPAFQPIVDMLARNNGDDVYLRHAGSLALARTGSGDAITALAAHSSPAVRMAAVIALRRQGHAGVGAFLDGADEEVVTEAARAINDDGGIKSALPALARILSTTPYTNEPLLRRVINANLRVGSGEAAQRVAAFAAQDGAPEAMRAEAIAVLGVWSSPSPLDRVDGVYLGQEERDPEIAVVAVEPLLASALESGIEAVQVAAAEAAARLEIESAIPHLLDRLQTDASPDVRVAALDALHAIAPRQMEEPVRSALGDEDQRVRMQALSLIPTLSLDDDTSAELLAQAIESGTIVEQQGAIGALGEIQSSETRDVLAGLVEQLEEGEIEPEIELDVLEAVEVSGSDALLARVEAYHDAYRSTRPSDDPLVEYRSAIYGGDPRNGARIVYDHEAAQCVRCHVVRGYGGDVGPDLSTIGSRLSNEQLLESLVAPSARIAPGYGSVSVTLDEGEVVTGLLKEETDESIVVQTPAGGERRIPQAEIADRTNAPSAMPPMGSLLTKRELRDVVAFMASLTRGADRDAGGD